MDRRAALKGLFAFASASVMGVAAAAPVRLSAQEQVTIEYMSKHGVTSFLMMNEKRGHLLAIENGAVVEQVPALSGARRGDDRVAVPGSTPSRIFPLLITDETRQGEKDSALLFDRHPNGTVYVIHRAPLGKAQRRLDRLNGAGPFTNPDRDRRISSGCINVRDADYDLVSAFAVRSRQTMTKATGERWITSSWLVVLPETSDPAKTIAHFERFAPN